MFGVLKSVFTLGIKSDSAAMDVKSAELREDGILLHLDRMTNKLLSFVAGAEGHGDELISHIALTCRQVNDHLVIANVERRRKIGPAAFGKANVQKVGYGHSCSSSSVGYVLYNIRYNVIRSDLGQGV